MKLTVQFVWIGQGKLRWLEFFVVYAWRMWGCNVRIFTHYPGEDTVHSAETLGLPDGIAEVLDLPTWMTGNDAVPDKTAEVLTSWYERRVPAWNNGGQAFTYNMVDLTKSSIAGTEVGLVMDMKIGPTAHLKTYFDAGAFHDYFNGYKRAGTIENQCMGSMAGDHELRHTYMGGFDKALFATNGVSKLEMIEKPTAEWFGKATAAHTRAMGSKSPYSLKEGLKGNWLDLSENGKAKHGELLGILGATFEGIEGRESFGPLRNFKREDDQTNKASGQATTDEERLKMQRDTFRELASASLEEDAVDVTAPDMPSIKSMLELLRLSKKPD